MQKPYCSGTLGPGTSASWKTSSITVSLSPKARRSSHAIFLQTSNDLPLETRLSGVPPKRARNRSVVDEIFGGNGGRKPRELVNDRADSNEALESPVASSEEVHPPGLNPNDAYDAVYRTLREQTDEAILRTLEEAMIQRVLKETGGNQVKASRLLGITRATLRKRIVQYSISLLSPGSANW